MNDFCEYICKCRKNVVPLQRLFKIKWADDTAKRGGFFVRTYEIFNIVNPVWSQ